MFTLGGWQGINWREKVLVQNFSEAQKTAWVSFAGSLMAKMKQNLHFGGLDCLNKQ